MKTKFLKIFSILSIILSIFFIGGCTQGTSVLEIIQPTQSIPNVEGYPVFSNGETLKDDIKETIQSHIDTLDSEIGFIVEGQQAVSQILELDETERFNKDSELSDYIKYALDVTLMDMSGTNINPYARSILDGYSVEKTFAIGSNIENTIQVKIVYKIDWGTDDPYGEYQAVVDNARNFLESDDYKSAVTDKEKIQKINEYITNTFQYDYRYFNEATKDKTIYSAYEMITDNNEADMPINGYPRGVCQAYTEYGFVMLREAGFESISVSGTVTGANHIWNMVKIDGNWYHIDFTWDDPISYVYDHSYPEYTQRQDGKGYSTEDYLLVSDDYMRAHDHKWNAADNNYVYPIAPNNY